MNKISKRKWLVIALVSIGVLLSLNVVRLLALENMPINVDFESKNQIAQPYLRSQGNYVLYTTRNGILDAPFISGSKLYLYSIKEDKGYLIKVSKGWNNAFTQDLTIYNDIVLSAKTDYTGGIGSIERDNIHREKLTSIPTEARIGDNYCVTEKYIYFSTNGDENIMRLEFETGKTETIIKGVNGYLAIFGETMYVYETDGNYIVELDLKSNTKRNYQLPDNHYLLGIVYADASKIIYLEATNGSVLEFNKRAGDIKTIASLPNGLKEFVSQTSTVKNEFLYCNDSNCNIYRVNYESGEIKQVVKMTQQKGSIDRAVVSYCDDYIVLDVVFITNNNAIAEIMYIYNYDGKLLRTKTLKT